MTTTKQMMTVVALAAAVSAGVLAQTAPPDGGKPAKSMPKPTTYTGCVAAGTTGNSYTLTHSMAGSSQDMGKGALAKDKDAVDKGSMGKDAMMASTMMLLGTRVDFSKHVGHRVSVTGMMAEPNGMEAMQKSTEPGKLDSMPMRGFTVTSMKMISSSCDM